MVKGETWAFAQGGFSSCLFSRLKPAEWPRQNGAGLREREASARLPDGRLSTQGLGGGWGGHAGGVSRRREQRLRRCYLTQNRFFVAFGSSE